SRRFCRSLFQRSRDCAGNNITCTGGEIGCDTGGTTIPMTIPVSCGFWPSTRSAAIRNALGINQILAQKPSPGEGRLQSSCPPNDTTLYGRAECREMQNASRKILLETTS